MFILSNLQIVPHISDETFKTEIEKEHLSQEQLDELVKENKAQAVRYGIASVTYLEGDKSITVDNILVNIFHQAVSYSLPINAGFTNPNTQNALQLLIVNELVRRYNILVESSTTASSEPISAEVVA
jgi:gamma-glutamyl:cysteine ligase YbdK (ATP-grasp superfamily)